MTVFWAIVAIIVGLLLLFVWSLLAVAARADDAAERAEQAEREVREALADEIWERELAALLDGWYDN